MQQPTRMGNKIHPQNNESPDKMVEKLKNLQASVTNKNIPHQMPRRRCRIVSKTTGDGKFILKTIFQMLIKPCFEMNCTNMTMLFHSNKNAGKNPEAMPCPQSSFSEMPCNDHHETRTNKTVTPRSSSMRWLIVPMLPSNNSIHNSSTSHLTRDNPEVTCSMNCSFATHCQPPINIMAEIPKYSKTVARLINCSHQKQGLQSDCGSHTLGKRTTKVQCM